MRERWLEELTLNAWPAVDSLLHDGWHRHKGALSDAVRILQPENDVISCLATAR